jgi:arginine/lysine/ornithine decarboxylase
MAGRGRKRTSTSQAARTRALRALERRLARLDAERAAERERQARQLARVRRAADRRLAAMVAEIAALRHHEARAEALERLLAEREAALDAERARVAELEALLAAAAGSATAREAGGDGQDSRSPRG